MIKLYNKDGVEVEADAGQIKIMEAVGWSRQAPVTEKILPLSDEDIEAKIDEEIKEASIPKDTKPKKMKRKKR